MWKPAGLLDAHAGDALDEHEPGGHAKARIGLEGVADGREEARLELEVGVYLMIT